MVLMAFGENKAGVVRQAVEGPVSEQVAASYLQEHPDAAAYVDYAAAAGTLWSRRGATLRSRCGVGPCCGHAVWPRCGAALRPARARRCTAVHIVATPWVAKGLESAGGRWPRDHRWRLPACLPACLFHAGLTRVQCPWVLGPIAWDATQVKKAACWLAQQVC